MANSFHEDQNDQSMADRSISSGHRRKLATALYLLTTSLLFADQNLLAPNLSAIADEFHFDDIERDKRLGGDIAIAFFMIGVPASFVVGCLADAVEKRSLLFLFVILIGEGACLGTYFVTSYHQLFWCRALTGCSVGGALPLIYSVLGDYYKPRERGWVSGAISMGCGIGISFGQGAAGLLGPRFGWRMPFLVVSVPAMICAVGVWALVPEVARGAADKNAFDDLVPESHEDRGGEVEMSVSGDELGVPSPVADDSGPECNGGLCEMRKRAKVAAKTTLVGRHSPNQVYVQLDDLDPSDPSAISSCDASTKSGSGFCGQVTKYYWESIHPHAQTLKILLQCPSVVLGIIQGAPGCVPWGIINTYLNDYLSSDQGLSVEGATFIILVFGVGNLSGTCLGGIGASYLYTRFGRRYPSILSSIAAIAGCFPLWALLNLNFNSNGAEEENGTNGGHAYSFLAVTVSFVAGFLSAITGPIVKSTLQNVTLPHMRGQAFALLNTFDDFGRGLGPAFVAWMIEKLGGRKKAFNIGVCGWIFCGVLNGLLFFTVESDEEKVALAVEEQMAAENETADNSSVGHRDLTTD